LRRGAKQPAHLESAISRLEKPSRSPRERERGRGSDQMLFSFLKKVVPYFLQRHVIVTQILISCVIVRDDSLLDKADGSCCCTAPSSYECTLTFALTLVRFVTNYPNSRELSERVTFTAKGRHRSGKSVERTEAGKSRYRAREYIAIRSHSEMPEIRDRLR